MLTYCCENCKHFILWGRLNEFNQHFCNENCYMEYCEKNKYTPNIKKLKYIKGVFN